MLQNSCHSLFLINIFLGTAQQTLEKILSFAWLAYDVLALVKQEHIINEEDHIPAATPLYEVSNHEF